MASKSPSSNGPEERGIQSPDDLARKISRQAVYERALPRRFYEKVEIRGAPGHFELCLDGKPVRTPMKKALVLPNRPLAEAVAEEWQAQGEHVDPDTMPVTRLANTTIDRVAPRRSDIVDEIVAYAGSDLLCYRASDPRELIARHVEFWDPILDWVANEIGARFVLVEGVIHREQPVPTQKAVRAAFEAHEDFALTGLHNVMTLTGSAILALALVHGHIGADDAWAVAHVDEDWQIEQWGEDEEARLRREQRRMEFDATYRFISLAVGKTG